MSKLTVYQIEEELLKPNLELNKLENYLKNSNEEIKFLILSYIKENLEISLDSFEYSDIDHFILENMSKIIDVLYKDFYSYSPELQIIVFDVFLEFNKNFKIKKKVKYLDLNLDLLLPQVKVEYLKLKVITNPSIIKSYPNLKILINALEKIPIEELLNAEEVILYLVKHKNFDIQKISIDFIKRCIKNIIISSSFTINILLKLIKSEHDDIILQSLEIIRENYFIFPYLPKKELNMLSFKNDNVVISLIKTLALFKDSNSLIEVVKDFNKTKYIKYEAIKQLQYFPEERFIAPILELTSTNYLFYGDVCLDFFIALQRKGILIDFFYLKNILNIFYSNQNIDINSFADLFRNSAYKISKELLKIPFSNLLWNRIIELLEKINTEETDNILVIIIQNKSAQYLREKALIALKNNSCYKAEKFIHEMFDYDPYLCLNVLNTIASKKTIPFLIRKLQLNSLNKLNFMPWENEGIKLLLKLSDNTIEITKYFERYKIDIDEKTLNLLSIEINNKNLSFILKQSIESDNELLRYQAIKNLGDLGNEKIIQDLSLLLLDKNEEIVTLTKEAIKKIISKLYNKGKIRTLLNKEQEVIDEIFSTIIIKLIKREVLSDIKIKNLLSELSTISSIKINKDILSLINNNNPHIQKFIIEYLGNTKKSNMISYLVSFITSNKDIYTLRQAIIACTKIKASCLLDEIIVYLKHQNMNIKKTVAEFLINVGDIRAVKLIIQELKVTDNIALRELIKTALKNILGDRYIFALVNELNYCNSVREKNLIIELFIKDLKTVSIFKLFQDYPKIKDLFSFYLTEKDDTDNHGNIKKINIDSNTRDFLIKNSNSNTLEKKELDLLFKLKGSLPKYAQFIIVKRLKNFISNKHKNFETIFKLLKDNSAILSTEQARLGVICNDSEIKLWSLHFILLEEKTGFGDLDQLLLLTKDNKFKKEIFNYFIKRDFLSYLFDFYYEKNSLSDLKLQFIKSYLPENLMVTFLVKKLYEKLSDSNLKKLEVILSWILSFSNSLVEDFILTILKNNNQNLQILLLNTISQKELIFYEKLIIGLFKTENEKLRLIIAKRLLDVSTIESIRAEIINNYLKGYLKIKNDRLLINNYDLKQISENYQHLINQVKENNLINLKDQKIISRINYLLDLLSEYPDDFIYLLLYEFQNNDDIENLNTINSLKQIPIEKLWNYIKPKLYNKDWIFFDLISDNKPINYELLEMLEFLPTKEKYILINFLIKIANNKNLTFPQLANKILTYCKNSESYDIEVLYKILFNLKDWNLKENDSLTKKVLEIFKNYPNDKKESILQFYIDFAPKNFIENKFVHSNLLSYCNNKIESEKALKIIFKGSNWLDLKIINKNMAILESNCFSTSENVKELFYIFSNRIKIHSKINQISWLSSLYKTSIFRNLVIDSFIEMYLEEKEILNYLSKDLLIITLECLVKNIANNEYSINDFDLTSVLKNLSEKPFPSFINLLENIAVFDKKTKYRLLAHRLLKKCVSKEKYFEVTKKMLNDKEDNIKKSAIKILAFGNYIEAVNNLIELLYYKKEPIRNSAYNGLKIMGISILPFLEKELSKQRPDKRFVLESLIKDIKSM